MKNESTEKEKIICKSSITTGILCALTVILAGFFLYSEKKQVAAAETTYDYVVTDKQFGVNANDTKSDSDGIQDVLTLAKGAKRQIKIYFPAGDYYISKPMRVYSNTHIILDKNATVHRMDSMINRGLLHNVDQNGKMDAVGGYKMSENITLEGGTWDGGNIEKATSGSDIIRFDHATNIIVKNCTIKNTYDCHLIEYVGIKNGSISGCTLTGFRYHKGKEKNWLYAREAIQLETAWTNNPKNKSDTSSLWAKGSVVDGTSCQQVTVTNNTLIDMPCGIGQHHYTTNGKYRNLNITISNNTITCSSKWKYCKTAITCGGMNTVKILNNNINGLYRFGVHVVQANGITISGNQITNITQNAIMVDSGKVKTILNNIITSTKKHGISVGGGSVTSITGNTIKKGNHNGISVDKGKVTLISKNTIKNIKKHGISITGGTIGTGKKRTNGILANVISTCKHNGISVSGKSRVSSISKNKINGVKNNGISVIQKTKVYWITNNTIKKCTKHGIWNGSTKKKAKLRANKGKTK